MSTTNGRMIPRKEQRPAPKPKKLPKAEEVQEQYNYAEGYYYYGQYYGPPRPLRLVPYLPWRKAWTAKDETNANANANADANANANDGGDEGEEVVPRVDGKTKSLIKRLNKSPNSVFSKERTQMRNKSRQQAQIHHRIMAN